MKNRIKCLIQSGFCYVNQYNHVSIKIRFSAWKYKKSGPAKLPEVRQNVQRDS